MEAQRYPISVRLIGVMHKEKSKMYMTSVLWSDQSDIVVYRTYMDFKKMHKQMKKAFPPANKMRKSDRILPKFRGVNRGGRRGKGPTRSLVRLKFLQKYCNGLLSCDPRVAQSTHLIQFFHPKDQDVQPEFAKNSIMIMPSDDEIRSDAGQIAVNVTQPFVTETYRSVAPYETKDTKNKPFKVAVDEKVDVLIKDKAGWWLVENEGKQMAWFPAPYLEKLDDYDDDNNYGSKDHIDGISERGMLFNAVKSYKAAKDDEMTVVIGAVVEVLQKSDNGWWLIRYNGKAGYIPAMYLQPYKYPHIRMTSIEPDRRNSSPSLEWQSNNISLPQRNQLQLPHRSSSTCLLPPQIQQRSQSVEILSDRPPAQPAVSITSKATSVSTSPTTANPVPPPRIRVEMDGEDEQRGMSLMTDSEGSLESDSSDFSSDLNTSWASSSSFNLSQNEEQLHLSKTPPPKVSNHLSPTSGLEGKMIPSVSDPNLYKGPVTPKVPPRPKAQEILTRCTTVTRKNATKGYQRTRGLSPIKTEIISR